MKPSSRIPRLFIFSAFLAQILRPSIATAGDPSYFVKGVAEAPPEVQIRMLRVIFDDLFGTPDEILQHLSIACSKREEKTCVRNATTTCTKPTDRNTPTGEATSKSKEVMLAGLCAGPIRSRIESNLKASKAIN